MRRFKLPLLFFLTPLLCSCYILEKLPELSTMGEYSRDKDDQHKFIKKMNANYDALLAAITAGDMKQYSDKVSVLKNFEDPITIKVVEVEGQAQERWLYRHAIPQKAQDKVYLYFDQQGKLIKYEQEKIQW